jgi:hypothetical protein
MGENQCHNCAMLSVNLESFFYIGDRPDDGF